MKSCKMYINCSAHVAYKNQPTSFLPINRSRYCSAWCCLQQHQSHTQAYCSNGKSLAAETKYIICFWWCFLWVNTEGPEEVELSTRIIKIYSVFSVGCVIRGLLCKGDLSVSPHKSQTPVRGGASIGPCVCLSRAISVFRLLMATPLYNAWSVSIARLGVWIYARINWVAWVEEMEVEEDEMEGGKWMASRKNICGHCVMIALLCRVLFRTIEIVFRRGNACCCDGVVLAGINIAPVPGCWHMR